MSKRFVIADPEKCTGCRVCELACSAIKEKTFNPRLSRIKIVTIEPYVDTAIACRLCETPRCVRFCPQEALSRDVETGVVSVDEMLCSGCGWCVEVCGFGAVMLHPSKKVPVMCDLCGGKPLCVEFCLPKAIEFTTLEAISEKKRTSVIKELFDKLAM